MQTIHICGVPEHFNLPWHFAMEEGAFADRGIELIWTDVPEGTGKMSQMLASGQTDLAIILTEGLVKSISEGNPSKIVQTYIQSPLLWGIHVSGSSSISSIAELQGKKAAISRFGSGSHLMAYVHARFKGWPTENLQFEVVNHLEGAIEALTHGQADYFMWEHFTTKPFVDNGTFNFLGDCPTPWPCFVIAGTTDFLNSNKNIIEHLLEVINDYTLEFRHIPSIDRTFSNRYGLQLEDVREWLSHTYWSQEPFTKETLQSVQDQLGSLDLLGHIQDYKNYLWGV